jgi:hypothetical protein
MSSGYHWGEADEGPNRGGNSTIRKGYENDFRSIWLSAETENPDK